MSNTTGIAANKYVSLTTFTKAGAPKPLPVWIVELPDGRVGFTTSGESWKAKRVANDPKVTLQACNSRGVVEDGAPVVTGEAVIAQGVEFEQVQSLVKQKYGVWVTVVKAMNTVRSLIKREETQSESAMLIALD